MAKKHKKQTSELLLALLFSAIAIFGYAFNFFAPYNNTNFASAITTQAQTQGANTEIKTDITFVDIPFKTNTIYDSSMPKGSSVVTVKGVKGQKTVTYQMTYIDGEEVSKTKLTEEVIKKPTDQVVKTGTYVAKTLGTNTTNPNNPPTPLPPTPPCDDINYVYNDKYDHCIPNGATGLCNLDNWYVYSSTSRCSRHGGIKEWYL